MPVPQLDLSELQAHLTGYWLTDLANFSSFLFHALPDLNWVGFYLNDGQKLRLGPFMGKPACTEIRIGHGVCGKSFQDQKALIVADVDAFPDHIRCDSASRSEMVIPFFIADKLVGVLDLDSPSLDRFKPEDLAVVQKCVDLLSRTITLPLTVPFA